MKFRKTATDVSNAQNKLRLFPILLINFIGTLGFSIVLPFLVFLVKDFGVCGHKHRPWLWNLGALQIAYAGTTSSERYRGFFENTYNIVNIDDGKVSVDMKIVGGKRIPLVEIVEKYKPYLET